MAIVQRNVNVLTRIDLLRLAGIKRFLGVDLTEHTARIVELERRGSVLNKYTSGYRVTSSLSIDFTGLRTIQEKASKLQTRIREEGITTRYAISSVRSLGVKRISAIVPPAIDDIDEWIREHYEKLLKLPLPLKDISFRHEVLEPSESGSLVEITFARNSDLEEYRTFFGIAGLDLVALGAETRDVLNALYITESSAFQENATLVHVSENSISITVLKQGKRATSQHIGISQDDNVGEILSRSVQAGGASGDTVIIAGESYSRLNADTGRVLMPFGLSAEFALAAGLAVKGFLPEINPVDFLAEADRNRFSTTVHRLLTQRTVLALGSVIILLLVTQIAASIYLRSSIDRLDEQLISSGPIYSQITTLEQQVKALETKLQGGEGPLQRTNFSRVLHDLGAATPESVWLQKLTIIGKERRQARLSLAGYAKANEDIAGFLKKLQDTGLCSEVKLVRSASPGQSRFGSEPALPPKAQRGGYVTFEINATVRE